MVKIVNLGSIRLRPEAFWLITPSTTPLASTNVLVEKNAQRAMDQAVKEGQKLLQGRLFEE